jgi:TDG/mug DNA glycosylase family protein
MTTALRDDREATPSTQLQDVLGPAVRLLLVGVNPALRSAAVGHHFAGRGNRFWPALYAAGITPMLFRPTDDARLPALGVGLTNLVGRPSARASDVTAAELRAGSARLTRLVAATEPVVVAVLGVGAYRRAFERRAAHVGPQAQRLAGAQLWVLPNPSGLNAHVQLSAHAAGLRAAADAAGIHTSREQSCANIDARVVTR